MQYLQAEEVVFWIVAIPAACLAFIFFVVFPVLIFVAALFETEPVRRLRPLHPNDEVPPSRALGHVCDRGFTLIGQFSDEQKKRSFISLALSPDRVTLLLVLHRKVGGKYELITRYSRQRWIITSTP